MRLFGYATIGLGVGIITSHAGWPLHVGLASYFIFAGVALIIEAILIDVKKR